jgi:hypothetical protein
MDGLGHLEYCHVCNRWGGSPQKIAISVMRLQQPLEGLQAHELFIPSDFPKKI